MAGKIYNAHLQYLLITPAIDAGLDRQNRVVGFYPKDSSVQQQGLSPLLVYTLVVPAYGQRVRLLVDPREPISISKFLVHAWSEKCLLGMPTTLEVKPTLMASDRGFVPWVGAQGVACEVTSTPRNIAVFERSSREVRSEISWESRSDSKRHHTIAQANASLLEYHRFKFVMDSREQLSRSKGETANFAAWITNERTHIGAVETIHNDWDSASITMGASSRKSNPAKPLQDPIQLATPIPALKEIVQMWPAGKNALCKHIGVKSGDLDTWLACRGAIESRQFEKLQGALNLIPEFNFELGGGYLLVADTHKNSIAVYEELSHGGDLLFSVEVVSDAYDFSGYRVLLFRPHSGMVNIFLFPQNEVAARTLNRNSLINFQGTFQIAADVAETLQAAIYMRENADLPGVFGYVLEKQASRLD